MVVRARGEQLTCGLTCALTQEMMMMNRKSTFSVRACVFERARHDSR